MRPLVLRAALRGGARPSGESGLPLVAEFLDGVSSEITLPASVTSIMRAWEKGHRRKYWIRRCTPS